jgi:hypothetical protein
MISIKQLFESKDPVIDISKMMSKISYDNTTDDNKYIVKTPVYLFEIRKGH